MFTKKLIYLEHNSCDDRTKVVVIATGGETGLKEFILRSPSAKVLYKLYGRAEIEGLSARKISIASPEPSDLARVLKTYPEGEYEFEGVDFEGNRFHSTTYLAQDIPEVLICRFN